MKYIFLLFVVFSKCSFAQTYAGSPLGYFVEEAGGPRLFWNKYFTPNTVYNVWQCVYPHGPYSIVGTTSDTTIKLQGYTTTSEYRLKVYPNSIPQDPVESQGLANFIFVSHAATDAPVASFTSTNVTSNSVDLSWASSSNTIREFEIVYFIENENDFAPFLKGLNFDSESLGNIVRRVKVDSTLSSYRLSGLFPNSKYRVLIRPRYRVSFSFMSNRRDYGPYTEVNLQTLPGSVAKPSIVIDKIGYNNFVFHIPSFINAIKYEVMIGGLQYKHKYNISPDVQVNTASLPGGAVVIHGNASYKLQARVVLSDSTYHFVETIVNTRPCPEISNIRLDSAGYKHVRLSWACSPDLVTFPNTKYQLNFYLKRNPLIYIGRMSTASTSISLNFLQPNFEASPNLMFYSPYDSILCKIELGGCNGDSVKTTFCLNGIPKNFRVTGKTTNSITVSWDKVPNIIGYVLSYFNVPISIDKDQTSHTITDLGEGRTYDFFIKSVGNDPAYGTTAPATKLTATTLDGCSVATPSLSLISVQRSFQTKTIRNPLNNQTSTIQIPILNIQTGNLRASCTRKVQIEYKTETPDLTALGGKKIQWNLWKECSEISISNPTLVVADPTATKPPISLGYRLKIITPYGSPVFSLPTGFY